NPASMLERTKALPCQRATLLRWPVMEDHRVEVKIGWRQVVRPQIAPNRREGLLQPILDRELLRHVTYCGSVQPHRPQVGPTAQSADTMCARTPADIEHDLIRRQIDHARPGEGWRHADAVHPPRKAAGLLGLPGAGFERV